VVRGPGPALRPLQWPGPLPTGLTAAYRADVILRETVVVGLVGPAGWASLLLEALSFVCRR